MRAIRIHEEGGPEVLRVEDLPLPEPGPRQVRVRIEAAGVNFIDVYQRTGAYPGKLPRPLGLEGAGVVEALGPDVAGVAVGDRVAWTGVPGSYATHNLVPVDKLVPLPAGVDARAGAAAMLQGMTAHYLVHDSYPLGAGDSCLVHAAAGGVGLLLCQMGRRLGARVIGTVSSAEKAELARAAGATDTILYTVEDFAVEVKRLTGDRRVQVVYDSVGRDTFAKSLDCLAPRGRLILYGQSSGPVGPFDPQLLNSKGSLFLQRPNLAHHTLTRDELLRRAGAVLEQVALGQLKLRIGATFPLEAAAEAHRALEARRTTGKVLLLP
jgi:NADPH:quinone reductase